MPLPAMQFPVIGAEHANLLMQNLLNGQQAGMNFQSQPYDLQAKEIANALNKIKAQYAPQEYEANINHANAQTGYLNQQSQYYGPKAQADIAESMARAGLYGNQNRKAAYELEHQELMYGGDVAKLSGLIDLSKRLKQSENQIQPNPNPVAMDSFNGQGPQLNLTNRNMPAPQGNYAGDFFNAMPTLNSSQQQEQMQPTLSSADIDKYIMAELNKMKSGGLNPYEQKMAKGFVYNHAPVDAKNDMIAQLRGAGYETSDAVERLTNGESVSELLKEAGFEEGEFPEANYLLTARDRSLFNQRKIAKGEIEGLSKFVAQGLGEYLPQIAGMNANQISDTISGFNEDKQAKFLAAYALMPELTNLRLKFAGANVGITAQNEVMEHTYGRLAPMQNMVSKSVFMKSQELIDEKLHGAFEKAKKAVAHTSRVEKENTENDNDPLGIR